MTKDELIKHFSQHKYDDIREYAYQVMLEHPEVTDPIRICFAADQMDECAVDGVKISVDNALRLTEKETYTPVEELVSQLRASGIDDETFLNTIFSAKDPTGTFDGCKVDPEALRRIKILEESAEYLATNKDIVIIGRPTFWTGTSEARLALALFCEKLTDMEQMFFQGMKDNCDIARLHQEPGYLKACFFVENIWITE